MRSVRFPYRRSVAPAELEPWQTSTDRGPVEASDDDHLEWDPTMDLLVSRRIVVDGQRLRDDCALADGAHVRLIAGWQSDVARSRSHPWRYDLRLPDRFDGAVEFRIPGCEIATSVELVVAAVLVSAPRGRSVVAATVPGSCLWKDVHELRLEPTRGRFPMEWTDFASSGLPPGAAWYLDWPSQDWDAPLLGALRLRFNATNTALCELVELPDGDERRRFVIRSAILDVAKQLVIAALTSDEFVANHATFPEGSVGFSIRVLVKMAFPHQSMETVQTMLRDHAGEFHMQLQAGLVPFGDAR